MLTGFGKRQQQLLELLLENKAGMTMENLARALDVSKSAVHQHLTALERDGYVAHKAFMKTGGRPSQIYALTDRGMHLFPKQYAWFSELLLRQLIEQLGSAEMEKLLYRLGQETAAVLRERLRGKSRSERIREAVQIMQEFGYQAQVVESEAGLPEISAKNCVYHDLAETHPEVCALDMGLLDGLLEETVVQRECMVRDGMACRFCLAARQVSEKAKTTPSVYKHKT
ncbi:MAG: helix-turn-helix transcriptional regulator [Methylohalobius sp. ZOD2]